MITFSPKSFWHSPFTRLRVSHMEAPETSNGATIQLWITITMPIMITRLMPPSRMSLRIFLYFSSTSLIKKCWHFNCSGLQCLLYGEKENQKGEEVFFLFALSG